MVAMKDPVRLQSALATFFEDHGDAGIVSAYLFGGYRAARAHRDSDIDIGLLLDRAVYTDRRARFDARLRLTSLVIGAVHSNEVDLVVLNDVPPHLARAVVTEGLRLFCRDEEADHAFRRTALLRAADLEPFLRRARRVKLAALSR